MTIAFERSQWAVILGGSSGFGLATAKKLASCGMSVAVVHRDRRGAMAPIEAEFAAIRDAGAELQAFNVDALSADGRETVLDTLRSCLGAAGRVRLLMHSVAFGNLKLLAPLRHVGVSESEARARLARELGISAERMAQAIEAAAPDADALSALSSPPPYPADAMLADDDFARTVHAMGTSLATWAQDLLARRLFAEDARVIGMTSEGNEIAWRCHAAVAAARGALESVSRALALELAPYGVRSNVVQAGVTDTAALRLIPGSARMKARARLRNPFGRLTTPADVADVICLLCSDEAQWINGTIIRVDGGEHVSGE